MLMILIVTKGEVIPRCLDSLCKYVKRVYIYNKNKVIQSLISAKTLK